MFNVFFIYFLDFPRDLSLLKVRITKDALEAMNHIFSTTKTVMYANQTNLNELNIKIDDSSKAISNLMVGAVKKLAELVDVDYFKVLAKVFGDQSSENIEKINFVYNEVTEIYENGESMFRFFQTFLETQDF